MRSDLWTRKYGYSYNTVNKYRGVLYGDEAFLPPTPTANGRIRIANFVADKLREHGVRPRFSEATVNRRRWATKWTRTTKKVDLASQQPTVNPDEFAAWLSKEMNDEVFTQAAITLALTKHGMTGILEMLIEAETEINDGFPDLADEEKVTS